MPFQPDLQLRAQERLDAPLASQVRVGAPGRVACISASFFSLCFSRHSAHVCLAFFAPWALTV